MLRVNKYHVCDCCRLLSYAAEANGRLRQRNLFNQP